MMEEYAVVVGGMNMDICGMPAERPLMRDSNIGQIKQSIGGVGQNIAQNVTRLGFPVSLITVYGDDLYGYQMQKECQRNGVSLEEAQQIKERNSAVYLFVTDETGDMLVGVNEMNICELITPEFLEQRLDHINQAKLCIVDANLSEQAIAYLAENVTVPLLADPVSITKAKRIKPYLSAFDTLKPNRLEAELFTGVKIDTIADAKKAAQIMLDQGVKNVFISLGKDGILGANQSQMLHVSPFKTKIVNANGAGDCTIAAICWCRCHDIDSLQRIGWITQAAASLALESPRSVPEITPEKLDQKLTQVLLAN